MLNKRKLQSVMKLYGDTNKTLANAINIGISTMSCKMNGKIKFNLDDVSAISKRYELKPEDIVSIFLADDDTERSN